MMPASTPSGMLRGIRHAILRGAETSGITIGVLQSAWRRERLAILCYHGISTDDEHEWRPSLYMTPEQLRTRMEVLRRLACNVLPLGEAVQRLRDRALPERSVAITFDDGAFDFQSAAVPVLDTYGFPVTLYVSTWYVQHADFPVFPTALSYLLWKRARIGPVSSTHLAELTGVNRSLTPETADVFGRSILSRAEGEKWSGVAKHAYLEQLSSILDLDFAGFCASRKLGLLSLDELRALPSYVDMQLHTHKHLTPTDSSQCREEIEKNRTILSQCTRGGAPDLVHFCYPSGVVTPSFPSWLREVNVVSATTCDVRLASTEDDTLLLPRIVDTATMSETEFVAWVSGVRQMLALR